MHMHGKKCGPACAAFWLTVVGGLNWGLVGLGGFLGTNLNLVNLIVGSWPTVEGIVYLLVGAATIGVLVGCKCKTCKGGSCKTGEGCGAGGCCGGGCDHDHDAPTSGSSTM